MLLAVLLTKNNLLESDSNLKHLMTYDLELQNMISLIL